MKLYRVTLRGMTSSIGSVCHGTPYVVANDPTSAYETVLSYVNKKDYGFGPERELDKIELLAETGDYPECGQQLFL